MFYLFYRKGSLKGYQINHVAYFMLCCIFNAKIISMKGLMFSTVTNNQKS